MAEVKEAVAMDAGFRDVKVGTDEWDQDGVEDIVDEFVEELIALSRVRLGCFAHGNRWYEPRDARNLICEMGRGRWRRKRYLDSLHYFV